MHDVVISGALAIVIVVLVVIIFNQQLYYWLDATKVAIAGILFGKTAQGGRVWISDSSDWEGLSNPKDTSAVALPAAEVEHTLDALGYTRDVPWDAMIAQTELDPSTFVNHMDFVKDVRRFSSGANFTSVTDDNNNLAFTDFRGLRRPTHVDIGPDARQQPDIDESVLQRNKPLRW